VRVAILVALVAVVHAVEDRMMDAGREPNAVLAGLRDRSWWAFAVACHARAMAGLPIIYRATDLR